MLMIIVLGCFIDPSVLIVMFGSTVHAAGVTLGFDPIHYGVLMVITMLIGAITPPVGSMLFIACSIAGIPLEESLKPLRTLHSDPVRRVYRHPVRSRTGNAGWRRSYNPFKGGCTYI